MGEWVTKKLKEIAIIKMGQSPESLYVNEVGIGVPFLQGNAEFSSLYPKNKYWVIKPTRVSKTEDILLSVRAPVGETNIADREYCIGRGLSSIEFHIDKKFGWYLINKEKRQLKVKERGSTFTAVNKKDIETIDCFFPEEKIEQSKIAEILTTIDNTIEQTEKIIAKYRRIKQGLLQDLLTKGIDENGNIRSEATHEFKDSPLGRIPVEWDIVPINSIGKIITGNTPSTKDLGNFGGNYLFVTPSDISGKEICKTERTLTDKGMKFTRIVPKNSICVVCIGSTIGKIGIIKHECATNQQINTIICSENVDYNYIYYACLAYLKRQLDIEVGLQAVPIVNKNTFSTLLIPLMGKPEQVRISHILNKIDYSIKDEQKYYNKLKAIKQGLMQDLLSGKVRVTHLLDKGGKSDECHP